MKSFLSVTKSLSPGGLHKAPSRIQEADNEDSDDSNVDESASLSNSDIDSNHVSDKSGSNTDNEDDYDTTSAKPKKELVLSPAEATNAPTPTFKRHQVLNIIDTAILKKELKTMGSVNTSENADVKIVIEKKKLPNTMNKIDFDRYGVSIKLLKKLFAVVKKYCQQHSLDPYQFTIDQVINNIISPWTQRHNSSLCHILLNGDIDKDDTYISTLKNMQNLNNLIISNQANMYVIYTRSYYYYNFMQSIELLANNNSICYFWIDFLCMKQINNTIKNLGDDNADTKKESRPIKWFQNDMVDLMKNIGHTVLVLLKWTAPLIFTRSWCLFELYAAHLADCKFSIQLSRKRHNEFYRIVVDDYDQAAQLCTPSKIFLFICLFLTLFIDFVFNVGYIDVNIEQSTSRDGSDRDELLNAIYSISDNSFLNANSDVYNLLKNWLLQFSITQVTNELGAVRRKIDSITNSNCLFAVIKSLVMMRASKSKLQSLRQKEYNLMHHLAALYAQVESQLKLSEETYRGALSYYDQHFGIDQLVSMQILSNLAVLHKKQNLLDDAENDYKSCLILKDDLLGPSHPSTLATCNNLALLYRDQHKFHDAIELLFRVLAGQEVSLGYDHDETLCTLENIAFTFIAMNRIDDAKELLVKSLGLKKEKYGNDSAELLSLYDTLVGIFEQEQDIGRTKRLYDRIIDIRCISFGPFHPTTLVCQKRLGSQHSLTHFCIEHPYFLLFFLQVYFYEIMRDSLKL